MILKRFLHIVLFEGIHIDYFIGIRLSNGHDGGIIMKKVVTQSSDICIISNSKCDTAQCLVVK